MAFRRLSGEAKRTRLHTLPLLPGATQRYWLGAAFSSPSPIVLVTMLHFSRITVRKTFVPQVAFLELTARLCNRLCNFVKFLSLDHGECATILAFADPNI